MAPFPPIPLNLSQLSMLSEKMAWKGREEQRSREARDEGDTQSTGQGEIPFLYRLPPTPPLSSLPFPLAPHSTAASRDITLLPPPSLSSSALADALSNDLKSFALRLDSSAPPVPHSVGEYLLHLHEDTLLSSILHSQEGSEKKWKREGERQGERAWLSSKRPLLDSPSSFSSSLPLSMISPSSSLSLGVPELCKSLSPSLSLFPSSPSLPQSRMSSKGKTTMMIGRESEREGGGRATDRKLVLVPLSPPLASAFASSVMEWSEELWEKEKSKQAMGSEGEGGRWRRGGEGGGVGKQALTKGIVSRFLNLAVGPLGEPSLVAPDPHAMIPWKGNGIISLWRLAQTLAREDDDAHSAPPSFLDLPPPPLHPSCSLSSSPLLRLLHSSVTHLQNEHARHVEEVIARHPGKACLGGSPSPLLHIQAFVRVMNRLDDASLGPSSLPSQLVRFDFDVPSHTRGREIGIEFEEGSAREIEGGVGGLKVVPTRYQQIFLCLRSGFWREAQSLALGSREKERENERTEESGSTQVLGKLIHEWISSLGVLSVPSHALAGAVCERELSRAEQGSKQVYGHGSSGNSTFLSSTPFSLSVSLSPMNSPELRARLMLLCMLSGQVSHLRRLSLLFSSHSSRSSSLSSFFSPHPSHLFGSLEDFLWFHLNAARKGTAEEVEEEEVNVEEEKEREREGGLLSLSSLQRHVASFDASHYYCGVAPMEGGGGEAIRFSCALRYALSLMLTLQMEKALLFLSSSSSFSSTFFSSVHLEAGERTSTPRKDPSLLFSLHAVHLAIALSEANCLSALPSQRQSSSSPLSSLVHSYGLSILRLAHKQQLQEEGEEEEQERNGETGGERWSFEVSGPSGSEGGRGSSLLFRAGISYLFMAARIVSAELTAPLSPSPSVHSISPFPLSSPSSVLSSAAALQGLISDVQRLMRTRSGARELLRPFVPFSRSKTGEERATGDSLQSPSPSLPSPHSLLCLLLRGDKSLLRLVLLAAAKECEHDGKVEQALYLLRSAGSFSLCLSILKQLLCSEVLNVHQSLLISLSSLSSSFLSSPSPVPFRASHWSASMHEGRQWVDQREMESENEDREKRGGKILKLVREVCTEMERARGRVTAGERRSDALAFVTGERTQRMPYDGTEPRERNFLLTLSCLESFLRFFLSLLSSADRSPRSSSHSSSKTRSASLSFTLLSSPALLQSVRELSSLPFLPSLNLASQRSGSTQTIEADEFERCAETLKRMLFLAENEEKVERGVESMIREDEDRGTQFQGQQPPAWMSSPPVFSSSPPSLLFPRCVQSVLEVLLCVADEMERREGSGEGIKDGEQQAWLSYKWKLRLIMSSLPLHRSK